MINLDQVDHSDKIREISPDVDVIPGVGCSIKSTQNNYFSSNISDCSTSRQPICTESMADCPSVTNDTPIPLDMEQSDEYVEDTFDESESPFEQTLEGGFDMNQLRNHPQSDSKFFKRMKREIPLYHCSVCMTKRNGKTIVTPRSHQLCKDAGHGEGVQITWKTCMKDQCELDYCKCF